MINSVNFSAQSPAFGWTKVQIEGKSTKEKRAALKAVKQEVKANNQLEITNSLISRSHFTFTTKDKHNDSAEIEMREQINDADNSLTASETKPPLASTFA